MNEATPEREPDNWRALLESIKERILRPARDGKFSGKATVEIDLHQGGVGNTKLGFYWMEKH